ncbi:MAG: trypsin-like peptidase domain-containing protein [Cyanobacteria bacterium P01_C01_bin.89]
MSWVSGETIIVNNLYATVAIAEMVGQMKGISPWSNFINPALMGATAAMLMVVNPSSAQALSEPEVAKIAQEVTVLIAPRNEENRYGSGILLAKEGDIYYVLTAHHVVKAPEQYEVQTADGAIHALERGSIRKLPGVDLAIAQFSSSRTYRTVELEETMPPIGSPMFVGGYPLPDRTGTEARLFTYTGGRVARIRSAVTDRNQGYLLGYDSLTQQGMSGGPVLNQDGRLIAIHGLSEDRGNAQRDGLFKYGIPVSVFLDRVPKVYFAQGAESLLARQYNQAIAAFRQALRFAPRDGNTHVFLAYAYFAKGDFRNTLASAEVAINSGGTPALRGYRVRGAAYLMEGNTRRALEDLDNAVRLGGNAIDYGLRGLAYARAGNILNGNSDANAAVKEAANSPLPYLIIGAVREIANDSLGRDTARQRASELLAQGQTISPDQTALARGLGIDIPSDVVVTPPPPPPCENGAQRVNGECSLLNDPPPPPTTENLSPSPFANHPAVGAIARAIQSQQSHRQRSTRFNSRITPPGTQGYNFAIRTSTRATYYYGIPRPANGQPSFVGALFLEGSAGNRDTDPPMFSLICSSESGVRPADPRYTPPESLRCAPNTFAVQLNGKPVGGSTGGSTGSVSPPIMEPVRTSPATQPPVRSQPPVIRSPQGARATGNDPAITVLQQMMDVQTRHRGDNTRFLRFPGAMQRRPYNLRLSNTHEFRIRTTTRAAYHYAVPRAGNDRGAVAAIFLEANAQNEARNPQLRWMICQADTPGQAREADPSYRGDNDFRCGTGTRLVASNFAQVATSTGDRPEDLANASPIQFPNVCASFTNLPHQTAALDRLYQQVPEETWIAFGQQWRTQIVQRALREPVSITNACRFYRNKPNERRALLWLQGTLVKDYGPALREFAQRWRQQR